MKANYDKKDIKIYRLADLGSPIYPLTITRAVIWYATYFAPLWKRDNAYNMQNQFTCTITYFYIICGIVCKWEGRLSSLLYILQVKQHCHVSTTLRGNVNRFLLQIFVGLGHFHNRREVKWYHFCKKYRVLFSEIEPTFKAKLLVQQYLLFYSRTLRVNFGHNCPLCKFSPETLYHFLTEWSALCGARRFHLVRLFNDIITADIRIPTEEINVVKLILDPSHFAPIPTPRHSQGYHKRPVLRYIKIGAHCWAAHHAIDILMRVTSY